MKIYTGYFGNSKHYQKEELVLISIARFNRFFKGHEFKILAPPAYMIHESEETYTPKYKAILAGLNKHQIINDIKNISEGKNCILLCYEKKGDFCHRHLVSEWLREEIEVNEFIVTKNESVREKKLSP